MDFKERIDAHFAGAVLEDAFVRQTFEALSAYGFNAENSIACVGVCRDEITNTLTSSVNEAWGEAFSIAGLGGLLFLGKTGLGAAHSHAPIDNGKERYVYYAMPHIAIDAAGQVGVCSRPGRPKPSSACGALMAFQKELQDGAVQSKLDPDDLEQSLLRQRLLRTLKDGPNSDDAPDLIALTKIAQQAILADLEHLTALTISTDKSDYAILSGVQIHGPDQQQYVWPAAMHIVKDGERIDLSTSSN